MGESGNIDHYHNADTWKFMDDLTNKEINALFQNADDETI
jgi:hypothetical protein